MVQSMAKVVSNGKMVIYTKAVFMKIKSKETVVWNLKMINNTLDHGKITRCMDRVLLLGQMEKNMKVNLKMIKRVGSVLWPGKMEEDTKDISKMGYNMEMESISIRMGRKLLENGIRANFWKMVASDEWFCFIFIHRKMRVKIYIEDCNFVTKS